MSFNLGEHKDLSFNLFWNSNSLISPNTWSLVNKLHLRTNYKNWVASAGVEDWEVFGGNRVPKGVSANVSHIHDVDDNTRIYGGFNAGVKVSPFNFAYGYLLAGFYLKKKHRLVVVAGGNSCQVTVPGDKSKNEEDKVENKIYPSVSVIGRTLCCCDSLETVGEVNVTKGCCEEAVKNVNWAVGMEYQADKATKIKVRACSGGDFVASYLHSYGVCDFGFISKVKLIFKV